MLRRCERIPSADEAILANMAADLKRAVVLARRSLGEGLSAVKETLAEMEARRREKTA